MCFVFTRGTLFALGLVFSFCVLLLGRNTRAIDCLERLVSEMTNYVSSKTLNHTHSPALNQLIIRVLNLIFFINKVYKVPSPTSQI